MANSLSGILTQACVELQKYVGDDVDILDGSISRQRQGFTEALQKFECSLAEVGSLQQATSEPPVSEVAGQVSALAHRVDLQADATRSLNALASILTQACVELREYVGDELDILDGSINRQRQEFTEALQKFECSLAEVASLQQAMLRQESNMELIHYSLSQRVDEALEQPQRLEHAPAASEPPVSEVAGQVSALAHRVDLPADAIRSLYQPREEWETARDRAIEICPPRVGPGAGGVPPGGAAAEQGSAVKEGVAGAAVEEGARARGVEAGQQAGRQGAGDAAQAAGTTAAEVAGDARESSWLRFTFRATRLLSCYLKGWVVGSKCCVWLASAFLGLQLRFWADKQG